MTLPTKEEARELFDYICQKTDYFNCRNGCPKERPVGIICVLPKMPNG